jgi:hypothetical protein
MINGLPMLVQLTEKDKRLLIALFILFIVIFVLIAYIVNGIKALMRRYAKGIDGYMHDLCKAGLIKNPKEFVVQVYKKETKVLYAKTRWAFRIAILITALLLVYGFVAKPSGEEHVFAFFAEAMNNLKLGLTWPRGEFFGIKNFPVDWPIVSKKPTPVFNLASIVTYVCVIGYIYVGFIIVTSTMKFIARLNRARVKSVDVFSKSLDNFEVDGDELNGAK